MRKALIILVLALPVFGEVGDTSKWALKDEALDTVFGFAIALGNEKIGPGFLFQLAEKVNKDGFKKIIVVPVCQVSFSIEVDETLSQYALGRLSVEQIEDSDDPPGLYIAYEEVILKVSTLFEKSLYEKEYQGLMEESKKHCPGGSA